VLVGETITTFHPTRDLAYFLDLFLLGLLLGRRRDSHLALSTSGAVRHIVFGEPDAHECGDSVIASFTYAFE